MNRHVFHPICKIHRRLCHRDLQNLKLKPLTTPQVHPLQAQNTIHGNLELITHFSVVYLYLSSQLTHALYLHCIGKPCDENGHYLPKGSPPPPRPAQAADGWTPFADRIQFKLADFLYRQEEMSQGNINHLLKLWALSLMQRGSLGSFDSYKHIYDTIDAIEEGNYFILSRSCLTHVQRNPDDAPWKCFRALFDEPIKENAPNWKKHEYDVWYRDPEVVARNMRANPDFAMEFDSAPYVELDAEGGQRWSDFMSGNFAWRQPVCRLLVTFILCKFRLTPVNFLRTSFTRKSL